MRNHHPSTPPARRQVWCHSLVAFAIHAMALPAAFAQTPAPLRTAAPAARTEAASTMTRAVTPVYPTAPCGRVDIAPVVQVSVGKSTVIKPSSPIKRILLGNPENSRAAVPKEPNDKTDRAAGAPVNSGERRPGVADVDILLLSPTEVYVLGKGIGSTNVVLLDQAGGCTAFDVVVGMDTAALQTVIGQLLPEETGIRVSSAYDSIVLTGTVADSGSVIRVMDLANAFVRGGSGSSGASIAGANPRIVNMLSTGSPQQVMLEVKVAEVSKSLIDKLGVQFSGSRTNGNWTYNLLANFLSGGNAAIGAAKSVGSALGVTLDAQKDDGLVKVLAEPTIMAISGQEGRFNAGGKIFIPVSQANANGGTTITLEEKEFGVSVRFRPTVLDGGRINLEMVTEVSELNREGIGIVAAGVNGTAILPSFTSRKAATTVQLIDGQSFAIGGLIKNNTTANVKAFPVLGELPVVGALFRSTEFQADKSELVFVVTPRLVKPLPANYALPTDNYIEPNRRDLMLNGRIEGRAGTPPAAAQAAPAPAAAASGGFQVK